MDVSFADTYTDTTADIKNLFYLLSRLLYVALAAFAALASSMLLLLSWTSYLLCFPQHYNAFLPNVISLPHRSSHLLFFKVSNIHLCTSTCVTLPFFKVSNICLCTSFLRTHVNLLFFSILSFYSHFLSVLFHSSVLLFSQQHFTLTCTPICYWLIQSTPYIYICFVAISVPPPIKYDC